MNFNKNFFEAGFDLVPDAVSEDFNSDYTGDRINLENYDRAYLVILKEAGDAGEDLAIALQQHTAASGGSSKALTFSKLWIKQGTLTSEGVWTAYELATASSDLELDSVNGDDLATDTVDAVIIVEVLTESLDINGSYKFVSYNNEGDDVGSALICSSFWLLQGSRYPQAIPLSPLA